MTSPNSHTQTGYTELDDVTAKISFLNNPDLMVMTFSYQHVGKCRWLLNAALTCKDFLDVALDELWGKQDSLVPLLKLLPALQVEDEAYVSPLGHRSVSQADWNRLQYYSRKVKSFIFYDDEALVHPSTSSYLRIAQLQPSVLFPSLRYLHWHHNMGDTTISHTFLSCLLSPLLDSLELFNIRGF